MWIKPLSYYNQQDSSSMYIIGGENGSAVLLMQIGTGYIQLKNRNVTDAPISDLKPIKNQWNLVGIRFLSGLTTNNLIYYCNGNEDTVTHNVNFTEGASSYVIGQSDVGVRSTDFMGYIDEFSIWKRALSAAEVALLYNSGDGVAYPFTISGPYNPTQFEPSTAQVGRARPTYKGLSKNMTYSSIPPTPPLDAFTVYHEWDFEQELLGFYSNAAVAEDFVVNTLYSHNSANIVTDEINGVETKVMRITHLANQVSVGFQLFADLEADYNEIYLSYNFKFSNEFDATAGGKLPGMGALPNYVSGSCPVDGQGFGGVNLFKYDGWVTTYHYDNTKGYCPWSGDGFPTDYVTDTLFLVNGNWYNITQRYVVNTFTAGNPNADGIRELWIDGKLIHRLDNLVLMLDDSPTMKIDELRLSHFYGGTSSYAPLNECYGYIDNIKVYTPDNDATLGTYNTHNTVTIIETPDEITDKDVYYDQLITTAGTLQNSQYGSSYSSCIDEVYLIDAGMGNTVSYTASWTIGGGDALTFFDGNQTDSEIIRRVNGYNTSSNQTITSTGRYLFVRFSSDRDSGTTGFTGTITFN